MGRASGQGWPGGETVVVSAAAGSVGSIVGQIAKINAAAIRRAM